MALIESSRTGFDIEDEQHWSADGEISGRMAPIIAAIIRERGGCLPQDLTSFGFTTEEITRCWAVARGLASIT